MEDNYLCVCGHNKEIHTPNGAYCYSGIKANIGLAQDGIYTMVCTCRVYKRDNLSYLEDQYAKRNL